MRIALTIIARNPTTLAHAGGDVRLLQVLLSLHALGHEIHMIVCDPPAAPLEDRIRSMCASVTNLHSTKPRKYTLRWLATRGLNYETLLLRFPNIHGLADEMQRTLDRISPDLVWAEEQLSAVLVPRGLPMIIGHVDFFFRLMNVRDRFRKLRRPNTMTNRQIERFEYALSRRANMTLVASDTDAGLFRKRGIPARYIPVVGETLPPPVPNRLSVGRFFLFGKSNTAMRAARQHLHEVLWPRLGAELQVDWHQVGDPPQRPGDDPSWQWMTNHVTVHGFVENLHNLFEQGDVSVMPYPIDASGHAKYAMAMGYGLVNIGYEAAFLSTPELVDGENSLMGKTTEEVVDALRRYRSDSRLRKRLAAASRATYEQKFSFEAKVPEFGDVIDQVMMGRATTSPTQLRER